jgi:hypothetical protein
VDTLGLLLVVLVTAAGVQDRDGARDLLWRLRAAFRRVSLVWADGGYAGKLVTWAANTLRRRVRIVNAPTSTEASTCCPAGGSWNAPSPGSPGTDAPSATTNGYRNTTKPWSTGP